MGLEPILTSLLTLPAIGGNTLSTSGLGRFLVFVYIWLPFMILPVQAALERLPASLLQASADLGARPARPFAMSFCRWRSRALPRVNIHLFPDAGGFHRSAAGGAAGLLHR
jgi:ABC-type sulfate transport system permease component